MLLANFHCYKWPNIEQSNNPLVTLVAEDDHKRNFYFRVSQSVFGLIASDSQSIFWLDIYCVSLRLSIYLLF